MERSCGPMNKNRIEGDADQGERAMNREALVIKGNPLAPHAELARGWRGHNGKPVSF